MPRPARGKSDDLRNADYINNVLNIILRKQSIKICLSSYFHASPEVKVDREFTDSLIIAIIEL